FATQPLRGFQAMGRVYAGWGLSQAFYREEAWRRIGFSSLEDFLVGSWEANFRRRDANDLVAMLWTWQHADISANQLYGGGLVKPGHDEEGGDSASRRGGEDPAADLVGFDRFEERAEIPFAKPLVALALDDLEENRADHRLGEDLQQQALALGGSAVDQDLVAA